ncbi:MAG: aminotransferase class I/II-fold pyridoxal phosphate-dependent enzyme [Candidatus Lokiarchaeota archaeon]|nr:aminotransferase class I/II-fold pyridoxal phosphate-dependent enzyme [Candidatus Lokiarchaeota archaeon]
MRFRTEKIMPPPIVKLIEEARRFIGASEFLNLGQGLPGHIPPTISLQGLQERLTHPSAHLYTPDKGLLELREELALYIRQQLNNYVNPETELMITAGGNNAFAGIALTLFEPGQTVIMPSPFYFNSVMAIRLVGGNVKMIPVDETFQPDPDLIEAAIDDRTRAIFLVSPNNPTGAVYEKERVDKILDLCLENELYLISDETYARMAFEGSMHYSPRSRRDAQNHVITIGSFSKDFGMSGWRIGYITGPEDFMEEYLKVQDTMTICAPTPSQLLALEILKTGLDVIDSEMEGVANLRELAYLRAKEIDQWDLTRTKGTFYLFPKVRGCKDSRKLVLDILRGTKTLVLPGSVFGEAGEGHIRLSIGPLTPEAVDEAFDRLTKYFATNS